MIDKLKKLILPNISESQSRSKKYFFIFFIVAYLGFYFFAVGKFSSYPWWHSNGSDADGAFAVTAISLLNDGDFAWVQHPAATFNALNAFSLRMLSFVSSHYKNVASLSNIGSIYEASSIIDKVVRAGRIQALILIILFSLLIFKLCNYFLKNILLSFLLSFYLVTSNGFLIHSYWIRAELLSVLVLVLMVGSATLLFHKKGITLRRYMLVLLLIGFLSGMAILTKMQALPAVISLLGILFCFYCFNCRSENCLVVSGHSAGIGLGFAFLNMISFPWWTLKRPDVFVEGFQGAMNVKDNARLFQKLTPESYSGLVFPILLGLFICAFLIFLLQKIKSCEKVIPFLKGIFTSLHCIVFGVIASIYLVLTPALNSYPKYVANTRVLVYTLMTNIFHGSFVRDGTPVTFSIILRKIKVLHRAQSSLLNISAVVIGAVIVLFCIFRLFQKKGKNKQYYFLSICFFAIGFLMDATACFYLRDKGIYNYYAIYSFTFFILGMAVWISCEIKEIANSKSLRTFSFGAVTVLVVLLSSHVILKIVELFRMPRADIVTDQGPMPVYENTLSYGKPFWSAVDKAIAQNQNLSFGQEILQYKKVVPKNNQSEDFFKKALYNLELSNTNILYTGKVIFFLKKAIVENPRRIESYMFLARVFMRVQSYQDAIRVLNASSLEFPNNEKIHYLLADCYRKIGNQELARYNAKMSAKLFSNGN